MAAPATLSPMPAASSLSSAPAIAPFSAPGSDSPGNTFDQQLQAARNSQSSDEPSSSDAPPASTPGANRQGDPSSSGAAKPTQESNMATVGSASTTATAGAASANASSKTNAAMNGQTVDAALAAMAQSAQAATDTGSGDAAPSTTAKAPASKTDATDDEGAASLAGAMLAMLGQVNGNMAGAQPDADDGTVSADGSSSGQTKTAMALQGLNANGQALAADGTTGAVTGNAASLTNFASMLGSAVGTAADTGADTHKIPSGLDALAFAATPMLPQPTNAQAVALPRLQMSSPAGSSGFAGELGQQVMWLGQQGVQQAKIRLNPQDLGSLDVHVSVNQNRIDVVFSAQHPAAVTAVQQSLPQLDNMLNRHGLSLGHTEVGQQQGGSGHSRGEGGSGAQASSADEIGEVQGTSLSATTSHVGLLDAFA